METQKENLSEKEVNQLKGIGLRQLRLMRVRGTGPKFIKISGQIGKRGGRVVYPVKMLDEWLNARPTGGGGADDRPQTQRVDIRRVAGGFQ